MGTKIELTDDEIIILDGRCSDATQAEVEAAKARITARERHADLPPELAALIADAVGEARANGRLIWQHTRVTYCRLCGRSAGYPRYKSGPRQGQVRDNAKPLTMPGVELARRFLSIQGHVTLGGCQDCVTQIRDALADELRDVPARVPDALRAEGAPKRERLERRECAECGWQGHEGQMRRLSAVMGGSYPGGCPECDADNRPFGPKPIKHLDGFVVVEAGAVVAEAVS